MRVQIICAETLHELYDKAIIPFCASYENISVVQDAVHSAADKTHVLHTLYLN